MILDHDPTSPAGFHTLRYQGEVDLQRFRTTEWLLTDGLGGFAMGTALGLNTRRYHGLLIHAARPPVGRVMALNTVFERFTFDLGGGKEESVDLSTFEFAPAHLAPRGFHHLDRFERGAEYVRWTYRIRDYTVVREVTLGWRRGGGAVAYRISGPAGAVRVLLQPMIRLHDFHHLVRCGRDRYRVLGTAAGIRVQNPLGELHLATSAGQFHSVPDWWFNFKYREETLRGMDDEEDLFTPGEFRHTFDAADENRQFVLRTAMSLDGCKPPAGETASKTRHIRAIQERMRSSLPSLSQQAELLCASDDFVVPRHVGEEASTTILAGYPWFGDWGRDTTIALPGLLLVTRRFDEALATLRTFALHRRNGLIPNLFDDYGGAAHYNTVDASLWFIRACCEYLRESGHRAGFEKDLLPACLDIVERYRDGTDFGIRMDPADGLIAAGDETTQLTWMDAKRDGVVFTPRYGKAVEVNALWHHGLRCLAEALETSDPAKSRELADLAARVARSFETLFWNEAIGGLADVLVPRAGGQGWMQDLSIRANQVVAVALRHSPLSLDKARRVVDLVERELLTPVGLRTLSPRDSRYCGRFEGDMFCRDRAYHQGTIWPWLLGPFVEALLRVEGFSEAAKERARQILARLLDEMRSGRSLGQLCEVYDADESSDRPRAPGGCMAQAWSVAALLRGLALVESGS